MNELSFDIKTSEDFLKKLLEDYSDYLIDRTSSRIALNCAMTAWHLTEWIYNEYNQSTSVKLPQFQSSLKQQCPSLQIMHDLANGTKHYLLTKHTPTIKETELHKGVFSKQFSRQFDVSALKMELNDGTKMYFEDEIKIVVEFWKNYCHTNHNIPI